MALTTSLKRMLGIFLVMFFGLVSAHAKNSNQTHYNQPESMVGTQFEPFGESKNFLFGENILLNLTTVLDQNSVLRIDRVKIASEFGISYIGLIGINIRPVISFELKH